MSYTLSPNMSLPVPTVGQEAGPTYATDINNSLTLVDSHDHTPGHGVQLTPTSLNINADLTFNGNNATNLAGLTLLPQGTTPGNNTIYESGVDLYYVDGVGNNVRLTQGGSIVGTVGSITGLVAPASASYVSGSSTFVWQSDTNIAANLDAASLLLRNISPNSTYALTLTPPASLTSNYQLVLPVLPSSQKIMTLDNSGNITAPYTVDGSTIAITSNVIGVASAGITTTQIAPAAVTPAQQTRRTPSITGVVNATITSTTPTVITAIPITTGGQPVLISLQAVDTSISAFILAGNAVAAGGMRGIMQVVRDGSIIASMGFGGGSTTTYSSAVQFSNGLPVNTAGVTTSGSIVNTNQAGEYRYPPGAFTHIDNPGAGTYTYAYQVAVDPTSLSGTYVTVSNVASFILEL